MTDINHLHPRSLRARHPEWKPARYRPLHKPLVLIKPGHSGARQADTYRARRRDEMPKSLMLKAERRALGISRREHDRRREEARKAG